MTQEARILTQARQRLLARLEVLEAQLDGDALSPTWTEYRETLAVLLVLTQHERPGERGELLTTREMAERLGLAPKTLLKHAASGAVRPALKRGKLIRWRGDEAVR
jgi:hypothetical protein